MAIQDDNTVLKKADLKAYHEAIAPMLGGSFMLSTNVSDYYSTDEKIVGVWLDGKPLYQKTYFTNDLENATTLQTKNISASFPLSNRPERIVSTIGCWRVGSNPYTGGTIPYVDDNYVMNAQLSGSQGYVQILYKGDWRNTDVYITLQYTKTGDTTTTALTTPGCYDINFPNTWPENTEIYFGNGLYGFRYIPNGVISCPNKEQTETYPLTNLPLTARFKSMGGCLGIDENNILEFPWNYVDASNSTSISAQCGGFYFSKDSNNKYRLTFYERNDTGGTQTLRNIDVWVTYTK